MYIPMSLICTLQPPLFKDMNIFIAWKGLYVACKKLGSNLASQLPNKLNILK